MSCIEFFDASLIGNETEVSQRGLSFLSLEAVQQNKVQCPKLGH